MRIKKLCSALAALALIASLALSASAAAVPRFAESLKTGATAAALIGARSVVTPEAFIVISEAPDGSESYRYSGTSYRLVERDADAPAHSCDTETKLAVDEFSDPVKGTYFVVSYGCGTCGAPDHGEVVVQ